MMRQASRVRKIFVPYFYLKYFSKVRNYFGCTEYGKPFLTVPNPLITKRYILQKGNLLSSESYIATYHFKILQLTSLHLRFQLFAGSRKNVFATSLTAKARAHLQKTYFMMK